MIRISQYAAPLALGFVLAAGVGCANRDREIPGDAVMLSEGKNRVSASANHDGTIYIWDNSQKELLYSGPVNRGDHIFIDPQRDEILVGGKVVARHELDDAHRYRIWLDEHPYSGTTHLDGRPATIQRETTVTEQPGTVRQETTVTEEPRVIEKKTTVEEKPAVIQEKTTVEREVREK